MARIELFRKQQILMACIAMTIIYGGGRGGGKSQGVSANKAILHIPEWYSAAEVKEKKIDIKGFRVDKTGKETKYFKHLIDYPDYKCVIVRRSESELLSNTKIECDKTYPAFGGVWLKGEMKWVFPSGAEVFFKSCNREKDLGYFQGPNFHVLVIEELTQFPWEWIEKIEYCCRSVHPILKAMKLYTTNPGGIGHSYVKEKYIDTCPALNDGPMVDLPQFGIKYQPLKSSGVKKDKHGVTFTYIPASVFENVPLMTNNPEYISDMLSKSNEILKRMWLFNDWGVFAGQFFDKWTYDTHVKQELDFYEVPRKEDLPKARREFDWSMYYLYRSYDYGIRAPWACGAYAVHKLTGKEYKFAEIVEVGLTPKQQAAKVNKFFDEEYDLKNEDFEMDIADPKSFWDRIPEGDMFVTAWDKYAEAGIVLTPGINNRIPGAEAVTEAFVIQDDGEPTLMFLSNCEYSIRSFPLLPVDPKNPEDVDTKADDHGYDETRYFRMFRKNNGVTVMLSAGKKAKDKTTIREKANAIQKEKEELAGYSFMVV